MPRRRPVAIPPQDPVSDPPRMHVLFDLMAALNVSGTYVEDFLGDPKLADSYGLVSLIGAARSITPTDVAARLGTAVTTASDRIRRLEIRVLDQGPGVAPEDRKRIFERFVRVKATEGKQVRGSGIGLALVKHIAEAHGGKAWVEANTPRGSVFVLSVTR